MISTSFCLFVFSTVRKMFCQWLDLKWSLLWCSRQKPLRGKAGGQSPSWRWRYFQRERSLSANQSLEEEKHHFVFLLQPIKRTLYCCLIWMETGIFHVHVNLLLLLFFFLNCNCILGSSHHFGTSLSYLTLCYILAQFTGMDHFKNQKYVFFS